MIQSYARTPVTEMVHLKRRHNASGEENSKPVRSPIFLVYPKMTVPCFIKRPCPYVAVPEFRFSFRKWAVFIHFLPEQHLCALWIVLSHTLWENRQTLKVPQMEGCGPRGYAVWRRNCGVHLITAFQSSAPSQSELIQSVKQKAPPVPFQRRLPSHGTPNATGLC